MSAEVTVTYRKRRTVELIMVLLAGLMGVGGYVLTHLFRDAEMPADWLWVPAIWLVIALAAHFVVRFAIPYADPVILPIVILLNGLGLAMIHRLDLATVPVQSSAVTQLVWTALAVIGFAATILALRNPARLDRFPYIMFLVGFGLLLLPLVPGLGEENYGARIWIRIAGYSFQPAEVAKIFLAVAFASYLAERRELLAKGGRRFLGIELMRPRDLGPILVMWGASLVIMVAQSDLGTSLLFFGLFVMMLYVATEKASWPILGGLLFAGGGLLAYQMFGHVRIRVSSWLDPFSNFDQNYQIIQGQFGMAWGGLLGRGWGLGSPSLTPLAKSDFIAAAIGEELGTVGLMAVIVLYGLLVTRVLRTALTATEPFLKLLASGLAFVVALQVFAIIGGVTRLLPLTGLTTPFMSQGGSSLLANWVIVALMLMISHHARKPRPVPAVAASPVASLADDATQAIPVAPLRTGSPTTPTDLDDATDDQGDPDALTTALPAGASILGPPADPDALTAAIPRPGIATRSPVGDPDDPGPEALTSPLPAGGDADPDALTAALPPTADPNARTAALASTPPPRTQVVRRSPGSSPAAEGVTPPDGGIAPAPDESGEQSAGDDPYAQARPPADDPDATNQVPRIGEDR
jgi:cell division protein FtsW (lipid II flippase)